jgi:hypothetical protein
LHMIGNSADMPILTQFDKVLVILERR